MKIGPAVSVIIPCFNAAATVREAVSSALRQTMQRIEIVIVDDGSKDDTAAIIAAQILSDPRIVSIAQANRGVAAARNAAALVARAPVLAFLDADDRWHPGHLAANLDNLDRNPQLALSFSGNRQIDAAGQFTGRCVARAQRIYSTAELLATNPSTTPSATVVQASAFRAVGGFDERLRRAEDQEFLIRLRSAGFGVGGICEPLVDYRMSPNSLSSNLEASFQAYSAMLDLVATYEPALVARDRRYCEARMLRHLTRCALERGLPRIVAAQLLARALCRSTAILRREPRTTLGTAIKCLVPTHRPGRSVALLSG